MGYCSVGATQGQHWVHMRLRRRRGEGKLCLHSWAEVGALIRKWKAFLLWLRWFYVWWPYGAELTSHKSVRRKWYMLESRKGGRERNGGYYGYTGMQDLWGQRERSAEVTSLFCPILRQAGGPFVELCPWCYWCNLSSNYFGTTTVFPSLGQRIISVHRSAWIQRRSVSPVFQLSFSIFLLSWSPTCIYSAGYPASVKSHFQNFQPQVKQYWLLRQFPLLTIKTHNKTKALPAEGYENTRFGQVPYWETPFSCLVQVVAAGFPRSGKTQALDSMHQSPKSVTDLWYKSFNIENVCLGIGKSTMFVTETRTNPFNCRCEKMLDFLT